jgi:hypothetical protein
VSDQLVLFSVTPGPLSITESTFSVDYQVDQDEWSATLCVTVSDTRGSTDGWSLNFSLNNCDEWTISRIESQRAVDGSAPGLQISSDHSAHFARDQVTLLSKDTQTGSSGSTGGVWSVCYRLLFVADSKDPVYPSLSLV